MLPEGRDNGKMVYVSIQKTPKSKQALLFSIQTAHPPLFEASHLPKDAVYRRQAFRQGKCTCKNMAAQCQFDLQKTKEEAPMQSEQDILNIASADQSFLTLLSS